jgi:hypothetical protein
VALLEAEPLREGQVARAGPVEARPRGAGVHPRLRTGPRSAIHASHGRFTLGVRRARRPRRCTSTSGLFLSRAGRVGDSALIGAGASSTNVVGASREHGTRRGQHPHRGGHSPRRADAAPAARRRTPASTRSAASRRPPRRSGCSTRRAARVRHQLLRGNKSRAPTPGRPCGAIGPREAVAVRGWRTQGARGWRTAYLYEGSRPSRSVVARYGERRPVTAVPAAGGWERGEGGDGRKCRSGAQRQSRQRGDPTMAKKVAILLGQDFEDSEFKFPTTG